MSSISMSDSINKLESSPFLLLEGEVFRSMRIDFQKIFYDNYILKRGLKEKYNSRRFVEDIKVIMARKRKRKRNDETRERSYSPSSTTLPSSMDKTKMVNDFLKNPSDVDAIQDAVRCVHRLQFLYRRTRNTKKIVRIQRWWKYWKRLIVNNNTQPELGDDKKKIFPHTKYVIRVKGDPAICCITQESIPVRDCFKYITPTGQVCAYTCSSLISYLRKSRKFECPATRYKFDEVVVRGLRKSALRKGMSIAYDLLDLYATRESFTNQEMVTDNASTGLERTCAEVFSGAVDLCETGGGASDNILQKLETDILPEWRSLVRMLMGLDLHVCVTMLRVEEARLTNLVSRNVDVAGYMPYLLDQIREHIHTCVLRLPLIHPLRRNMTTSLPILERLSNNRHERVQRNRRHRGNRLTSRAGARRIRTYGSSHIHVDIDI